LYIKMGNLSIYLKESMTKMSNETTLFLNWWISGTNYTLIILQCGIFRDIDTALEIWYRFYIFPINYKFQNNILKFKLRLTKNYINIIFTEPFFQLNGQKLIWSMNNECPFALWCSYCILYLFEMFKYDSILIDA
jgi:hypothetical protein